MKIKQRILKILALFGMAAVCLLSGQQVKADVEYDIENNIASAKVNADGSLTMKRQITYKFDDDAHGVFYQQNLGPKQKITDAQVKVQDNHGSSRFTKNFELLKTASGYRFKVYHAVADGSRFTVSYYYRITGAVTNYRDTAELNFKIIGNNWDTDLDHVKASVLFPGPVKGLKAWAHGPLDGYIKVSPQKGRIVMTVDNLDGTTGVEVHALFPLSVTPANPNVVDKNHRQAVLKQEANLAQAANRKRKRNGWIDTVLIAVALLSGLGAIIKGFTVKQQGIRPQKTDQLTHNYDIPDVDPVMAQILDKGKKPDSAAFTAYLMRLAAQKMIKIEDYQERRKTYYRISLVDADIVKQDDLLAALFSEVGDGESFTTKQLQHYHHKNLGRRFDDWRERRYKEAGKQNYIALDLADQRLGNQILIGLLLFIAVVAAFFAVMYKKFAAQIILVGILVLVLGLVALFVSSRRISIYTPKGAEETDKVRGFKKMLEDIGRFKMRAVGDLVLWEDIMPYAVSFDLAKKVLKELKIEFTDDELARSGFYVYGPFYSSGKEGFASSFGASFTAGISVGSSAAGSSGGFSGGSSGGFGGGSGGGAF